MDHAKAGEKLSKTPSGDAVVCDEVGKAYTVDLKKNTTGSSTGKKGGDRVQLRPSVHIYMGAERSAVSIKVIKVFATKNVQWRPSRCRDAKWEMRYFSSDWEKTRPNHLVYCRPSDFSPTLHVPSKLFRVQ